MLETRWFSDRNNLFPLFANRIMTEALITGQENGVVGAI